MYALIIFIKQSIGEIYLYLPSRCNGKHVEELVESE